MTIEKIKAELNTQYIANFCETVGKVMRRQNISCVVRSRPVDGTLAFNKISFHMRYVGFRFNMLLDETGTRFIVTSDKDVVSETVDLRQVKANIVKYIREKQQAKKRSGNSV